MKDKSLQTVFCVFIVLIRYLEVLTSEHDLSTCETLGKECDEEKN